MGSSSAPPSSTFPAAGNKPRRPWYLIVVLALAWLTGATSVLGSCNDISAYRQTSAEMGESIDRYKTEAEVRDAHERAETYLAVLDQAKNRKFPLSVATLLVGAAMVVFAQRAMVGREWARSLLVQLTAAHGAIVALEYKLTPDVQAAVVRLAGFDADTPTVLQLLGIATIISLATSLIIIIGLTRRGSRAFCHTVERLSQS